MSTPSGQSSLARFAFNIYGSLGTEKPRPSEPHRPRAHAQKKLIYACDREITCVTQLHHPLGRLSSAYYDPNSYVPSHHVVIGGKNYLKLLALNENQSQVVADVNLYDPASTSSRAFASKLFNVNTMKCSGDMVACGLTSGSVVIYQVASNGKSKLAYRLDDHKRVVNSVDFVESDNLLLSGSQDGSVRLWDLRYYKQKPVLKLGASQHSDPVRSCQYSPHSKVRGKINVLSVHDSGALCKYDLRYPVSAGSGTILPEKKWTFHTGPALSLHIHPEIEYVLTGGRDRKICAWNYAEGTSNSNSPDHILNTYGPVMKIRWNESPNDDRHQPGLSDFDSPESRRSALFNYDFACSYLNDDPSITVFNLARKYIPKEIVNTASNKPMQNFIWSKSGPSKRKLWAITKSNVLVGYDLENPVASMSNVTRPLEVLPTASTAWGNGYASLSVVSQESSEFDQSVPVDSDSESFDRYTEDREDERSFDNRTPPAQFESHSMASKSLNSSFTNAPSLLPPKSLTAFSPKERPHLMRSSTQFSQPANPGSPVINQRQAMFEPPGQMSSYSRPQLHRNASQSTVDSASSNPASTMTNLHSSKKSQYSPSPYMISLSIPIPMADEEVFAALATDYLIGIPEAFTLSFVCQINARVAASLHRFRDCQVWRLISVALDQEAEDPALTNLDTTLNIQPPEEDEEHNTSGAVDIFSKSPGESAKSISSGIGNLVGSYNSDSTNTTNYGRQGSVGNGSANLSILGTSKDSNRSFNSLREFRSRLQPDSPAKDVSSHNEEESTDQPAEDKTQQKGMDIPESPTNNRVKPNTNHDDGFQFSLSPSTEKVHKSNTEVSSSVPQRLPSRRKDYSPFSNSHSSQDLDDENLNFLNNAAASYSSSGFLGSVDARSNQSGRTRMSFSSKNSPLSPSHIYTTKKSQKSVFAKASGNFLDRVEESSINSDRAKSALTEALKTGGKARKAPERPWNAFNIIRKSLLFALEQGDLVLSATMILLFYEPFEKQFAKKVLSDEQCLECLGHYIETLRRKELFTIATQVVKEAAAPLQYKLGLYASKDIDMRFYCEWCQKVLNNEVSKAQYGGLSEKFGYWYCDECSRKQSNCVYCNEPCKGLTVVESLKCGHRGHFGCLQEWHTDGENIECPAGCD